jgi:hypothetical protein
MRWNMTASSQPLFLFGLLSIFWENVSRLMRSPCCLCLCIPPLNFWIYPSTALCWSLAAFSVSWTFYTVGRTPWTGDQPVTRSLPVHRTTQTQNKRIQTCMPRVGFEPMTAVFERKKTVHALDRTANVIGINFWIPKLMFMKLGMYNISTATS